MWSRVRKFGMAHCDLPTMMWNVSVLLRLLTLNIDSNCTKRAPAHQYLILIIIATCYFYVYLVSMVWFVFWRCRETGVVIPAMIVFSLGIASEIGIAKMIFMFLYNDTVKRIVDGYLACDLQVEPGSRFANNILKTLKFVKKRAILFWATIMGNGFVYAIKPILLPGRHMMEDLFIYFGLEPMFETPKYQIAFFCTVASIWMTCYPPSNITAFFIVVTGYSEAQMLALGEELNCLWDDALAHYAEQKTHNNNYDIDTNTLTDKQDIINDFIKRKLEGIIRSHTTNIILLRQVETVFRGVVAAEFTLLIVSVIAALLGGLENTWVQLPFAMMQVAMDCLTGQRLLDASLVFQTAVYNCKWENFGNSNMKKVLLMLQISQREMNLSAGGIATLSFSCLMSVIRSVYSAYTTLRTTM